MANQCSFDPSVYVNVPLGMFHCPECGEMVIAGMAHPDYSEDESAPTMLALDLRQQRRKKAKALRAQASKANR